MGLKIKDPFPSPKIKIDVRTGGELLVIMFLVVPCAFINDFIYGESAVNILSNFDTLFFHVMLITLLPIALNRLFGAGSMASTVLAQMRMNKLFTEKKYVHYVMIICYLWALAITFAMPFLLKCQKVFFLDELAINYQCVNYDSIMFIAYGYYCYVIPVISFVPYVILFIILRFHRTHSTSVSNDRKRIERRLMIQSTLILILFILFGDICFFLLFGNGNLATVLLTVADILNCSTAPVMYLTFNSVLRKKALLLIGWKATSSKATTVAPTTPMKITIKK
jgi:hypothetical protein